MWTELRFGKHKGKTLPQVVFSDPDYFFWASYERIFEGKGPVELEAKRIFDRAKRIRIRQDGEEKLVAEYLIHAPTGTFGHLQFVPESQPRHQGSSPVLRMDVIDLSVPYQIKKYDKSGGKLLVRAVKFHLFGSVRARLTAKRCAAFFDDDGNFEPRA